MTHWCFDVGVRIGELWEVAGYVCWMYTFLSGRQRFGRHRGIRHWSLNFSKTNTNKVHNLGMKVFFCGNLRIFIGDQEKKWATLPPRGELNFILTGSYDHPLWSLGINRKCVRIKPCGGNILKNVIYTTFWKHILYNSYVSFHQCLPISIRVTTVSDKVGTLLAVCSQ